jgi:16S rRNA (uracil1498-N3)-methyltransferase
MSASLTAPRLFVAPERLRPPEPVVLVGAEHHYLTRVLRLRVGDPVVLLDGQGRQCPAQVARVDGERVELHCAAVTVAAASGPRLVLLCGLLKGDKQDFVIQKATELGAHAVVPVVCQRSVPQLEKERADKRQQRWTRIALAAAQQCRRPDVPTVAGLTPFAEAIAPAADAEGATISLLLYEGLAPPLHTLLPAERSRPVQVVRLLIGPEGGFSEAEVAAAVAAGFAPASLGPRVLRAETAVVAALAVLQYALAAGASP